MSIDSFFHVAFVSLFVAFFGIRAYWHRRAAKLGGPAEYHEGPLHTAMRLVVGVPFLFVLVAYMIYPTILAWANFPAPLWLRWVGLLLMALSIPLVAWVHQSLAENFSLTLHLRKEHELITHGPYRYVRHPMYSALYMHLVGVLFLTANAFIGGVLLAALTCIVATRISREEALLAERFPDEYPAYRARRGRLLPRLRR